VESITSFLFLLGKLGIVGGCGIASYIWLDRADNYQEGACSPCAQQGSPAAATAAVPWLLKWVFLGGWSWQLHPLRVFLVSHYCCTLVG